MIAFYIDTTSNYLYTALVKDKELLIEKKEYKKGHYDKSNFEEEELEDDDYYSEDD